jgi:glycosyltransferase involved in cell wall biosynthesis
VVPPRDAAALAAAISRLLDDTVLAKRLGAAARNVASTIFSKESMLDKMEGLFALAQRGAA